MTSIRSFKLIAELLLTPARHPSTSGATREVWSTLGILSSSLAIADSETTSTTTGLWKTHTLNEFFEVRSLYEAGEFPEPSNWRKVYLVRRHPF